MILYLIIFWLAVANCWNQRVTCRANNLGDNQIFSYWLSSSYFKKQISRELLSQINKALQFTGHYGMPISQKPLSPCQNFMMFNESCCSQKSLDMMLKSINEAYEKVYGRVRPSILIHISSLYKQIKSYNCKPYPLFTLPGIDKDIHQQRTEQFEQIVTEMDGVMEKIKNYERKFMNQTICLFCISVKDLPNFIYPIKENFNSIIFNKEYFQMKIQEILSYLMELETLHDKIKVQIIQLAQSIDLTIVNCQRIAEKWTNENFIESLKVCKNRQECKRLAVQYFGNAASPLISRKIKALHQKTIALPITYRIYLAENFGFQGNTTQRPLYGIKTIPTVQSCPIQNCSHLWKVA